MPRRPLPLQTTDIKLNQLLNGQAAHLQQNGEEYPPRTCALTFDF